jgi:hypothetical protein
MATGTVAVSRDVRLSAMANSFQLKMNASTPAAISPGTASGRLTRQNACRGSQPSTSAASSSSCGISRKKAIISQIVIGRLTVTCVRTRAARVS